MGFVLKELTDDEREQMGFARTMDDIKLLDKKVKYVAQLAMDLDNNASFFSVAGNFREYELHWEGKVVAIKGVRREFCHEKACDESGIPNYDVIYTIEEVHIPKLCSDDIQKIKEFITNGYIVYENRIKHNGKVEVIFLEKIKLFSPKQVKSKVKVSDINTIQ